MSERDYFEKDYYATLGVAKDATPGEIAKAYRKMARENHPDAKPDDAAAEARFKAASEAYSVLSSKEKRAEYDKVRDMVAHGGGFAGGGPFTTGGQAGGFDISDLLGSVFGQGAGGARGARVRPRGAQPVRGRDLETSVTLDFDDAMAGVTTTLRVMGEARCETCGGSGAAPGTAPVTCDVCGGQGVVASNQGLFSFSEPCRACGGTGRQIPSPCPTCAGTGTQVRARDIRARIPAGVKDGARVRLAGKGEPGPLGGPAGDLFVRVHVADHPIFARSADDLVVTVPITYAEAVLGTLITVPTLDRPVTVRVPAGTPAQKTLRVRGKGVPAGRGRRGDLLVRLEVAVPTKLTRTQKKALEDFAHMDDSDPRAALGRYLDAQEEQAAEEPVEAAS